MTTCQCCQWWRAFNIYTLHPTTTMTTLRAHLVSLSVCLSACLPVCLPACLSACLSLLVITFLQSCVYLCTDVTINTSILMVGIQALFIRHTPVYITYGWCNIKLVPRDDVTIAHEYMMLTWTSSTLIELILDEWCLNLGLGMCIFYSWMCFHMLRNSMWRIYSNESLFQDSLFTHT